MSEKRPEPSAQPESRLSGYMETRKRFFARTFPEGYAEEWAEILQQPMPKIAKRADSTLVFRIASLPLAIQSRWVEAVSAPLIVCPVPHRDNTAFLGLVAFAGDILPCCSLARILGAADSTTGSESRTIVLEQRPGERWAFPVDAVVGISSGNIFKHEPGDRASQLASEWSDSLFEDDRGQKIDILQPQVLFKRLQKATA